MHNAVESNSLPRSRSHLLNIWTTVTDWNSGIKHIDVWTGSSTSNGGQNQINCEDDLTPSGTQQVVRSPPSNLAVDCNY